LRIGFCLDVLEQSEGILKKQNMSGAELWSKLQKIGFSQVGFARAVGVGDRSVRGRIAEYRCC
jgi:hypothetical protein